MTSGHQDHDDQDQDQGDGVESARPLPSGPTPDYGAPWLPITTASNRS